MVVKISKLSIKAKPIVNRQHRGPYSNLGQAIKDVRIKRGMTQKELGSMLGFSENTADIRVAQYEAGNRSPKAELLQKIQSVLNCEFRQINYVECEIFD